MVTRRSAAWFAAAALVVASTVVPQPPTHPATVSSASAPGGSSTAQGDETGPVRIMLVGDSVTQGSAGDWTWRYRLDQHLRFAGVAFDLVGPRQDLYDNVTGTPGSLAYADPAFDLDHAARWGLWVGMPDIPIADLVAAFDPDVIVEMLGVNDLLYGAPPALVADQLADFVRDAQAQEPTVDVVLAEATQHWFAGVPEFNAALDQVAATTTMADSTVTVAQTATDYDAEADTWDYSHPNGRGEVLIAAAIADSLHLLGIGPPAGRPLIYPPVGPRTGAQLAVRAGDGAAELSWTGPPGATGQYVWMRDVTAADPWRRVPFQVPGPSWATGGLVNGHRYRFRVQPVKGDDEPEGLVLSNTVEVTPRPPAPTNLRAVAGRRCARLTWTAVAGASGYRVSLERRDRWAVIARPTRRSVVVEDLPRTRSWSFRVRSSRDGVLSLPASISVRRTAAGLTCR